MEIKMLPKINRHAYYFGSTRAFCKSMHLHNGCRKKIVYFSYFLLLKTLKCRYYVRNDDHSGDYLYAVEQKRIHSATACCTSATAFTIQARRYQTTRY